MRQVYGSAAFTLAIILLGLAEDLSALGLRRGS